MIRAERGERTNLGRLPRSASLDKRGPRCFASVTKAVMHEAEKRCASTMLRRWIAGWMDGWPSIWGSSWGELQRCLCVVYYKLTYSKLGHGLPGSLCFVFVRRYRMEIQLGQNDNVRCRM